MPARVSETDAEASSASLDLAAPTIRAGIVVATFAIDPTWKAQLLIGWDDTDLTIAEWPGTSRLRREDLQARLWATPAA